MNIAALEALSQTPRLRWYIRHGAAARVAARVCWNAGARIFGALTFRQGAGLANPVTDLGGFDSVLKDLFHDEDVTTPPLQTLLRAADVAESDTSADMPAEVAVVIQHVERLLLEISIRPDGRKRRASSQSELIELYANFFSCAVAIEAFCNTCESDIVALLAEV